jgi:DNA-binding winged helix-turn-helix (wHTH) protein/TolB-like protein/Tfp pilus assembly protein PilF
MPDVFQTYRFGEFVLETREEALYRDGERVPINNRNYQVLLLLVQRAGEIVSKQEFFDAVWGDTFVEDNSLTVAITSVRKALGDTARDPRFIENKPRRGYRFIGEVAVDAARADAAEKPAHAAAPVDASRRRRASFVPLAALAAVLLVAFLGAAYWAPGRRGAAANAADSLLVLPIRNDDAASEYLSDGLTEQLTDDLAKIPNLKVVSRNSAMRYKGRQDDLAEVGRELGVATIVNGRMAQSGEKVSLAMSVYDARTSLALWSRNYEASPAAAVTVFADILRDIRSIVGANEALKPGRRLTTNPEALDLYLRARYHWNKRTTNDIRRALALFQDSVDKDPTFALAYVGMANCYAQVTFESGISATERAGLVTGAARKALEIDESNGEAYSVLGLSAFYHKNDFAAADAYFKKGVELNPGYATGHHWYADFLGMQGRFDESFREYDRALELEPDSLAIKSDIALNYYFSRRYEKALEELNRIAQINPNFQRTYEFQQKVFEAMGRYPEAIGVSRTLNQRQNQDPALSNKLAAAFAQSGPAGYWREKLKLNKDPSPWDFVMCRAALNELDEAFRYLDISIEKRVGSLIVLKVSPEFDNLRGDPRFAEALRRVGFTE